MNDTQHEIATKTTIAVVGAIIVAVITGFPPWAWGKLKTWWKRPGERRLWREAVEKLTDGLSQMTTAVRALTHGLEETSDALHVTNANVAIILEEDRMARWWTDESGRCQKVNKALCALFGMSREDLLANDGFGWLGAIYEGHRQHTLDAFRHAVSTGIPYSCTYAITKEGKLHSMLAKGHAVKSPRGKVLIVAGTVEPFNAGPKDMDYEIAA